MKVAAVALAQAWDAVGAQEDGDSKSYDGVTVAVSCLAGDVSTEPSVADISDEIVRNVLRQFITNRSTVGTKAVQF